MTDKDIIKALEELGEQAHGAVWWQLNETGAKEVYETAINALALINRQQAENERLQSRNNFLEIEYKNQGNLFWERINGAKAEAVKEFADQTG